MKYPESRLEKVIHIKHGFAFKGEYFSLEKGDKIVLTPGNFFEAGGFRLRSDKDRFYTSEYPCEYLLKKNDLIIAMTEQTYGLLGSPAWIPNSDKYLHNQRLGKIEIIDKNQISKKFLYYLFFVKAIRDEISNSASGTKIRHTAPERIYKVSIPLPPLPIQRKIAAILSAYDDLIENNNRRIAILEKMAEELYREWFVRLRFPGHEKVKIIKGVPEGWEVKKVGEIVESNPSVKLKKGESAQRIEMEDVQPLQKYAHGKMVGPQVYNGGSKFSGGDTLVARITPCLQNGKIAKVGEWIENGFGSTEFFVLRARKGFSTPNFVYYLAKSDFVRDTAVASMTGASGRQRAELQSILNILSFLPPISLIEKFEKCIQKMDQQIQLYTRKNAIITTTRDRLLTRLMSGKIDVENLDIQFPSNMRDQGDAGADNVTV